MEITRRLDSCAPPACSCPIAEMDDNERQIAIKDDYGGEVIMSYEEFTRLARQFLEYV